MQGVWRVFATYVAAVAGIFAASGMAIVTLKSMFPDTPDQALLQSLPALIAGSLASSFALIFTLLAIVQPATPAALRLLPGWESGRALAVMALGMLALGQTLDSLTWLVGFGERAQRGRILPRLEDEDAVAIPGVEGRRRGQRHHDVAPRQLGHARLRLML